MLLDDAHADKVAEVRRQTRPVLDGGLSGALIGLLLPLVVAVPGSFIGVMDDELYGIAWWVFPGLGALITGAGGLLVGWADVPGRLAVALARRESPVALVVMTQAGSLVVGVLWLSFSGAAAAGLTGIALGLTMRGGPDWLAMGLGFAIGGWFTAMLLGLPAVVLHATARALCVSHQSPPLVPVAVGGLTAAGVVGWLGWLALLFVGLSLRLMP